MYTILYYTITTTDPPTAVTITPTHQIVGQDAIVECSTDDSNPPARIEWEVRGRGEEGQDGEVRILSYIS